MVCDLEIYINFNKKSQRIFVSIISQTLIYFTREIRSNWDIDESLWHLLLPQSRDNDGWCHVHHELLLCLESLVGEAVDLRHEFTDYPRVVAPLMSDGSVTVFAPASAPPAAASAGAPPVAPAAASAASAAAAAPAPALAPAAVASAAASPSASSSAFASASAFAAASACDPPLMSNGSSIRDSLRPFVSSPGPFVGWGAPSSSYLDRASDAPPVFRRGLGCIAFEGLGWDPGWILLSLFFPGAFLCLAWVRYLLGCGDQSCVWDPGWVSLLSLFASGAGLCWFIACDGSTVLLICDGSSTYPLRAGCPLDCAWTTLEFLTWWTYWACGTFELNFIAMPNFYTCETAGSRFERWSSVMLCLSGFYDYLHCVGSSKAR